MDMLLYGQMREGVDKARESSIPCHAEPQKHSLRLSNGQPNRLGRLGKLAFSEFLTMPGPSGELPLGNQRALLL